MLISDKLFLKKNKKQLKRTLFYPDHLITRVYY